MYENFNQYWSGRLHLLNDIPVNAFAAVFVLIEVENSDLLTVASQFKAIMSLPSFRMITSSDISCQYIDESVIHTLKWRPLDRNLKEYQSNFGGCDCSFLCSYHEICTKWENYFLPLYILYVVKFLRTLGQKVFFLGGGISDFFLTK